MDMRLTPLENIEKEIDIAAEVTRLAKMTVPELRTRHAELFGGPAKSHHREFLARQIAWRLQAFGTREDFPACACQDFSILWQLSHGGAVVKSRFDESTRLSRATTALRMDRGLQ